MKDQEEKIKLLLERLDLTLRQQNALSKKVDVLKKEVYELRYSKDTIPPKEKIIEKNAPLTVDEPVKKEISPIEVEKVDLRADVPVQKKAATPKVKVPKAPHTKSSIEKFIGENLISKIGIIITIIGVAIGAQYSIENDLISPMTRIILGYLVGLGLLGFGIYLKPKYPNYSAVLVSGAMTIMYFLTFAAYSFYGLFAQSIAFGLMVIFTIFTVFAAILYNKQVIALIGLVGAYTVPFLLSSESGNVTFLFTYMTIINAGILAIAVMKDWKPLYYTAFVLTWMIFGYWFAEGYKESEHFNIALIFSSIFFVLFYTIFLVYKLVKKEKFNFLDILVLLANSFIFYGLGFAILFESYEPYLGLFTLANAFIHFIVSALIYQQKLGDRNLFYLISGLVMVFITIAIPVQLDGNWVTLLWISQAALLFWIGRTKKVAVYEFISYPLMAIAAASLFHDWGVSMDTYSYGSELPKEETAFLNIRFLSSMLFVLGVGLINFIDLKGKYASEIFKEDTLRNLISFLLRSAFLLVLFLAVCIEISAYFDVQYMASKLEVFNEEYQYNDIKYNYDLMKFKYIWIINFGLFFLAVLSIVNIKIIKDRVLGFINIGLNIIGMLFFLTMGLLLLSELRNNYMLQTNAEYYNISNFNIIIRYISLSFALALLATCFWYVKQAFMELKFLTIILECLISIAIIWILSSELLHWMDLAESTQSYKLGLSIFWGIASLALISIGIWKHKIHFRIIGFALFAVTLIKLFVYDISHLDTISKTIVFISLGILLLIISFLYNKYKHIIADETPS